MKNGWMSGRSSLSSSTGTTLASSVLPMVFNLSCFLLFLFLFSSSSVAFLLLSHCPLVLVVAFSLLPWLLLLLLPLLPPSLLVVVAAVVAVLVFFLLQHPNTCFDLSTEFQQLLKLIR